MKRRHIVQALGALALAGNAVFAGSAMAQAYPSKPIRLIVPFAPGGVSDTSARVVADKLGQRLGQQVVVENKPGASGNIGTAMVAQAAPDGYTLVLGFDGTMVINPHVYAKVPFDPIKDFVPIGKIGDAALILIAHPSVPAKNLQELVAYSRSREGGLSYGSAGTGSTPHLAGELLKARTGLNMVHVPYKGGGQAMGDLVGGTLPLLYTAVAGAQQYVKGGKATAIAVSGASRVPALPDVPTIAESGVPGLVSESWVGLLAPANTPKEIVDKLSGELNAVVNLPDTRERLATLGIVPVGNSSEAFGKQIQADLKKYSEVVKTAKIRVE
ncbi:tripartite tricarboxylate transporter substrate binding protein [Cupriavidus respiraculi]|uniref:Bug family tripartite tricarboxylate transporter substrate binding protein n=1 Tax=Cupriavidus respiraculi TaxID=195930 RepID=UPI001C93B645|nr:tripartite tricarboxylate transporter substrate binding protein [Cupriavidus respiraculi]MBY4948030.1 tripartite tricarboxylate transporter substrate binding protein [Cupriavidus respiraculi]